jgi:hypothetical protein
MILRHHALRNAVGPAGPVRLACLASVLGLASWSGPASAVVEFYADQAEFDAAATTTLKVTFDEPAWDPFVGKTVESTFTLNGVTFDPFPGDWHNFSIAPASQDNFCCARDSNVITESGNESIDLIFLRSTNAAGFDYCSNDGEPVVITATLSDDTVHMWTSPQPPCTYGFVGVASDVPIARINWTADLGETINTGIDNVISDAVLCPADVNADGVVNVDDLFSILNNWGDAPHNPADADTNDDGVVNVDDLFAVLNNWGACP